MHSTIGRANCAAIVRARDGYIGAGGTFQKYTVSLLYYLTLLFVVVGYASPVGASDAVEYYHAGFDHYFVTSFPTEVNVLDSGTIAGWTRTGETFEVQNAAGSALSDVCRFFSTTFAPKSSHFYSANANECNIVRANHDWQYEAQAFYVGTPDANGNCAGGQKVYRLYNDGHGSAPNHRYTTSIAIRALMMNQGWVPEGNGADGVVFCTAIDSATTPTNPTPPTTPTPPVTPTPPPPTSEAYTKTAQLIGGTWSLKYTFGQSYTDTFRFTSIISGPTSSPYYAKGTNKYGDLVIGGWGVQTHKIMVVSKLYTAWDVYVFDYTSGNTVSGCYYFDNGQSNVFAHCTSLTGSRSGLAAKMLMERESVDMQHIYFDKQQQHLQKTYSVGEEPSEADRTYLEDMALFLKAMR